MMSFAANLVRARSHIVFVLGLLTAAALIVTVEERDPGRIGRKAAERISPAEPEAAALAWAQLPPDARTPHLRRIARELGIGNTRGAKPSAATATATLLAIHDANSQKR
jgi:hypothetical protein